MVKLIAATLLATAAMIGAAQADDMDVYQTCWAEASTSVLDQKGVTEETLKEAVRKADGMCEYQRISVMASGQSPKEMREYMEVQLYNANPVQETQVAAAEPERKIEKVSGFTPKVGYNLYNARTGFLCRFPSDVENARGLLDTNRAHLIEQIGGCVVIDRPIEVEKIQTLYSAIEVRYVNANGKMITAFTSDRTFRTKSEWNRLGIE
ncbi:hypothetical protein [Shinella zoogloeoides]|uniref:hypothetical protein n=1 Tax=Shinella zoogloeoides TaxID=352475 RepID=UPI000E6466F6|nr:hypothetical protein [Shinella zoogloeoides]